MYFIGGMMTCTKNIGHNFISQSEINNKLTIMLYAQYRIIKSKMRQKERIGCAIKME